MRRTMLLWILAFIVTVVSAVYQRVTGPTYPVTGTVHLGSSAVPYKLLRSQGGEEDAPVQVPVGDSSISGIVEWRRYNSEDSWAPMRMRNNAGVLEARLPHQPPAGKLEYRVVLMKDELHAILPEEGAAILRYKGEVPMPILVVHILAMFGAMLLSARTGLEFFSPEPRLKRLTYWTIGFLAFGGLVMGPVVQKYAFDAYWTGWPFGSDLTDNKTFAGLLGWVVAAVAYSRARNPRAWALGASLFLFVIYLIPHSVLGSEINYRETNSQPQRVSESDK